MHCLSGTERYVSNGFVADFAGAIGVDAVRIWVPSMATAKPDGSGGYTVTLNEASLETLRDQVSRLQEQGVSQIVAMPTCHVIMYDYPNLFCEDGTRISQKQYDENPSSYVVKKRDYYAVPDPVEESTAYQAFIRVQKEFFRQLSEAVPGITHFETINEPEQNGAVHPTGYGYEIGTWTSPEGYTPETIARICMDYNHAATEGIREAGQGATVLSPSLTATSYGYQILGEFYKYIKDQNEEPENYFEILNWHPYVFYTEEDTFEPKRPVGTVDDWEGWYTYWVDFQKKFYQVAIDAGYEGTPVWFTEMGVTDCGTFDATYGNQCALHGTVTEAMAAQRFAKMFELTEEKLPFVKTVLAFRISDREDTFDSTKTMDQNYANNYEANFGMVERFDACASGEAALKETGEAFYQIVNGGSKDYSKVYAMLNKYYNAYKGTEVTEDFNHFSILSNKFVTYNSETRIIVGGGAPRLQPKYSKVSDGAGGYALAMDFGEQEAYGEIGQVYGTMCFRLGSLEPGDYQVTFDISDGGGNEGGGLEVLYTTATTSEEPNAGVANKITNLTTLKLPGQSISGNKVTFTVTEKQTVYLYFQMQGKTAKDAAKTAEMGTEIYSSVGTFRVLLDNIRLTKTN